MKFEKTQRLGASMVGSDESLSVIGAFQIIEDTLTEFFGEYGIDGITIKQKYNAFWVFVKTRAKFFKGLAWNSEYTATACISSMSAARMHVDIEVRDGGGARVLYARVEVCVLDIAAQKIKRISDVGIDKSMVAQEVAEQVEFCKFDDEAFPLVEKVTVRSTNVDHSHHTNNLEYLRFIMNTYSVAQLEKKKIKEMEVIYASQSYEGDELDVLKSERDGRDLIVLQKQGKPVVKSEIVFACK
ncbi:MAG: hypothetical protein J1G38_07285 [Clostridiales bacterium]|nr:hypothetical protein [Clostridiales bacterium]